MGVCPASSTTARCRPLSTRHRRVAKGGAPPMPRGSDICNPRAELKEDSAGFNAEVRLGDDPGSVRARCCVFRWRGTQQWVLTDGAVRIAGVDFTKDDDTPYAGRRVSGHHARDRHTQAARRRSLSCSRSASTRSSSANMTLLETDGLRMKGRKFRTELNAVAGKLQRPQPGPQRVRVAGLLARQRDAGPRLRGRSARHQVQ